MTSPNPPCPAHRQHLRTEHIRLDEKQAISIVRQLMSALEFLHGRDIVHRDIKPANILLRGSGEQPTSGVRVLGDFVFGSSFCLLRRMMLHLLHEPFGCVRLVGVS